MVGEPTREQLIEQLQQEQGARLNQIASADPVINRIAGKLEVLQALNAEEPELKVVESEAEEDASGTLG
tara:strand:+ start:139 stop:345 length:207 start_codon:yes stop_codon:yes gene_type:complete